MDNQLKVLVAWPGQARTGSTWWGVGKGYGSLGLKPADQAGFEPPAAASCAPVAEAQINSASVPWRHHASIAWHRPQLRGMQTSLTALHKEQGCTSGFCVAHMRPCDTLGSSLGNLVIEPWNGLCGLPAASVVPHRCRMGNRCPHAVTALEAGAHCRVACGKHVTHTWPVTSPCTAACTCRRRWAGRGCAAH